MSDYLKKMKEALEKGQINEEIVDHHYEVLHTVDMINIVKANKNQEANSYEQEINGFINDFTTGETETIDLTKIMAVDDEVIDLPAPIALTQDELRERFEQGNRDAAEFEKKRKKKELIELNTAHIQLLSDENGILLQKVIKNKELMEYLKLEMERQ